MIDHFDKAANELMNGKTIDHIQTGYCLQGMKVHFTDGTAVELDATGTPTTISARDSAGADQVRDRVGLPNKWKRLEDPKA